MPNENMTLSQVIQSYSGIRTANRLDAFFGACLAVYCFSETLGTIVGWPTITGRLYSTFGFETNSPGLAQILLVLLLQLVIEGVAGAKLWRTNWPLWVATRARRIPTISVPDPNMRETSLGLLTGVVVTALLTAMAGYVPSHRAPLIESEVVVVVVSIAAIILALIFPPRIHYSVAHPDDIVFERITQASSPVQITLSQTQFQKSILLRRLPDYYEPCSLDGPISLDAYEHVLINYGVYEKNISSPVKVASANVFQCEGMFSLDVHPPAPSEILHLNTRGVEILINNLYTQHDFLHFLTERLTLAMNVYAGPFDGEVKTLTENFGLKALKTELETSHRFSSPAQGLGSALNLSAAHITQLEVLKQRIEDRLYQLEDYQRRWQEARKLQEQAVQRLPVVFEQQLQQYFTDKLQGTDSQAHAAIARLLRWARVRFFVSKFEFTPMAAKAETLLESEKTEVRTELKAVEQQIVADITTQAAEMRALLRAKADAIDPRLLMTPRGSELFEMIGKMLLLDNRTVVQQGPALLAKGAETSPPARAIAPPVEAPKSGPSTAAKLPEWLRKQREARLNENRQPAPPTQNSGTGNTSSGSNNSSKNNVKDLNDEPF